MDSSNNLTVTINFLNTKESKKKIKNSCKKDTLMFSPKMMTSEKCFSKKSENNKKKLNF